jgi:hypothetical protein
MGYGRGCFRYTPQLTEGFGLLTNDQKETCGHNKTTAGVQIGSLDWPSLPIAVFKVRKGRHS